MKKVIIIAGITSLIFGACTNTKLATYKDDVYASPSEERLERQRIAAEKKKQEEEEARKDAEEAAAQKAKEDANPYYKTPEYDKDDYYDYEYASRIRRFSEPVYGLGYYDNYYTNSYWYNGNPACYGTSIYNSYNYWGPSYGCSPYYGNGWSVSIGYNYGYGYPYGYGSPYGYNPYYNNAYMNGYYNGFNNGYNNGYYNGMYGYPYGYNYGSPYGGGWGYYNSYDVNSGYGKVTNAPRTSHDGGNGSRTSHPGIKVDENGYALKYLKEVKAAQESTPKFDPQSRAARKINRNDNSFTPSGTNPAMVNDGSNNPRTVTYPSSNSNSTKPTRENKVDNGVNTTGGYNSGNGNNSGNYNTSPGWIRHDRGGDKNTQQSEPVKVNQQPVKMNTHHNNDSPQEVKPNFNTNSPSDSPSNQGPRGGSHSGGNSGGRPR
jgi:hypothetical protein